MDKRIVNVSLIAALLFLLSVSNVLSAGQPIKYDNHDKSIEAAAEKCRIENDTGLGLRFCASDELKAWDTELNRVYKLLMNTFSSDTARSDLRTVQRVWLKYRDAEFSYIDKQFEGLSGSMYPRLIMLRKIPIVKSRVKQLAFHLNSIEL